MAVSDCKVGHGMDEVESSNLSRSTKFLKHLPNYHLAYPLEPVQTGSKTKLIRHGSRGIEGSCVSLYSVSRDGDDIDFPYTREMADGYLGDRARLSTESWRRPRRRGSPKRRACAEAKLASPATAFEFSTSWNGTSRGMSPDGIVSDIPSMTRADVHAALAYYFDHMDEIREEMRAERALVDASRRKKPSLLNSLVPRTRQQPGRCRGSRHWSRWRPGTQRPSR